MSSDKMRRTDKNMSLRIAQAIVLNSTMGKPETDLEPTDDYGFRVVVAIAAKHFGHHNIPLLKSKLMEIPNLFPTGDTLC